MNLHRIVLSMLTALFALLPLRATEAATIHTDGANYVTGVSALIVPGEGVFDVDFVFDSFNDLYGSIATPSPTPTFYNDPVGGAAAGAAMVAELNAAGGLLGVKDDVLGHMTTDANIPVTPLSSQVVVEGIVSVSSVWSPYTQVAFQFDTDFMHAVFTPVPEPGSLVLLMLGGAVLLLRRSIQA